MAIFKKQKGFTLVELLVVLAIVGILLALAVGGIRIVQEVNRDTQRKAFARDIQLALESYQEKNNKYPLGGVTGLGQAAILSLSNTSSLCPKGIYITVGGTETICSKINFTPASAISGGSCIIGTTGVSGSEMGSGNFSYCYNGTAKAYTLIIKLERGDPYNAGNE